MSTKKSGSLIDVSVRKGWSTFTKNPAPVVGAFLVGLLLSSVQTIANEVLGYSDGLLMLIISLVGWVISLLASLGMAAISLDFVDGKKLNLSHYYEHTDKLVSYFFASLLAGLAVLAGTIALILPGIYIAVRLQFFTYFLLEKKLGAMDALKASWKATSGHFFELLGLGIVSMLIGLLGLLALLVGFFIAVPVISIANAQAYRLITKK